MQLFIRATFSFLFVLLLSIASNHVNAQKAANSSFKMVQQGSSKAVIQIAENADSDECLAANELSDYVFKNKTGKA